jgi:hypothetical protein
MSRTTLLSAEAKAKGHQLYQALYGPVSEGVKPTIAQVQEQIDRLASPDVSADHLIRAAIAEASYRHDEASDDESAQTAEDYVSEPAARLFSNADVVGLLEDAQTERWDVETARQEAEMAEQEAKISRWVAEDAARGIA